MPNMYRTWLITFNEQLFPLEEENQRRHLLSWKNRLQDTEDNIYFILKYKTINAMGSFSF